MHLAHPPFLPPLVGFSLLLRSTPAEAFVLRAFEVRDAVGDLGRIPDGFPGVGVPAPTTSCVRRVRVLRQPPQLHVAKVGPLRIAWIYVPSLAYDAVSGVSCCAPPGPILTARKLDEKKSIGAEKGRRWKRKILPVAVRERVVWCLHPLLDGEQSKGRSEGCATTRTIMVLPSAVYENVFRSLD